MTRDQAEKILGVAPHAKPREIDAAYAAKRQKYLTQAQYATNPHTRDVANNALVLLQGAHRVFTGKTGPVVVKPPRATASVAFQAIPRVALGGAPTTRARTRCAHTSATIGRPRWRLRAGRIREYVKIVRTQFARPCFASRESASAFIICALMFAIALAGVVSIACRGR